MTAEMLLEQLFQNNILSRAVPINVETICSHYNISIEHKIYPDDTVGQIEFPPNDGSARIFINPFENSHINRRRFTIAHELGHFFLHKDSTTDGFTDTTRTMSRTTSYWDPVESEANDFAARLLMPEEFILSEGKKVIENFKNVYNQERIPQDYFISNMAQIFNVSVQAMTYRLKNLGII